MADIPESISGNCGAVKLQSNQKVQNQDGEHLIESWADKKNLISEGLLCEKKDNADPSISPLATKMNSKYDSTYDPFQLANAPPKIITNANPTRLAQKTPSASTEATSSSSPNRVKSILKRKPQITSDNVLDHLPLAIALPFRTADVVFDKATDGAAFIIKKTVINPVTTISSIFKPKRKYTTCRPNLNRRQSFSDGQPYPKMLPSQ
ncbi:hypothetical protein HK103_007049 [Boothiomyces macroporosus]|uniref:Uncharacterized protein n=1 Tax=Boothiomyces macroporosus TaxID=261099 RepID=A0AAD5UFY1_9FUNG|nr:hypothetical protein HK103_007049 [Boothiomyces macroporosus]